MSSFCSVTFISFDRSSSQLFQIQLEFIYFCHALLRVTCAYLDLSAYFDFVRQIYYFTFQRLHCRYVFILLIEFYRVYPGK
jgi:hypothetical protein